MSITRSLKEPEGPVRQFISEHFPNTRSITRAANLELKEADTIRPEEAVGWGTVGIAADQLIQFHLGHPSGHLRDQRHGVQVGTIFLRSEGGIQLDELGIHLEKGQSVLGDVVPEFFSELEEVLSRSRQGSVHLGKEDEDLLCRCCVVLALFEQMGRGMLSPQTPLVNPTPAKSVEELLSRIPDSWVEDLRNISRAFCESQRGFISGANSVTFAPTFEGSAVSGRSEADLLVDGVLLEIKTTVTPKIKADMIYQLLGYTLLDYADEYEIRWVGVYMARQAYLVRWELSELLSDLGCEKSLKELRSLFFIPSEKRNFSRGIASTGPP